MAAFNSFSPAPRRLMMIVVDECHCIWTYNSFQKSYSHIGALRLHLAVFRSSVYLSPCIGKVSDLSPVPWALFRRRSYGRRGSLTRPNILQLVAEIKNPRYANLKVIIPPGVESPEKIKLTLVFADNIDETGLIVKFLKEQLLECLQHAAEQLILPYSADFNRNTCGC